MSNIFELFRRQEIQILNWVIEVSFLLIAQSYSFTEKLD